MNLDKISVIIPIKEDSENLKEILENLSQFPFSDIHVIDSISCENNIVLCNRHNVNYTIFEWNGKFPKKRNWYLSRTKLREWVFFLDSDERLSYDFVKELESCSATDFDAYRIKYNNTFLGRKLKYGDIMTKTPLFKNHIRFEKIEELYWSNFDMEIHEHPVVNSAKTGQFSLRIDHLEKSNIFKYISKHNSYSEWESKRIFDNIQMKDTSIRSKLKYALLRSRIIGVIYFLYAYLFRLGFLDGYQGYYLVRLKIQYFFWIRLKYKYETVG